MAKLSEDDFYVRSIRKNERLKAKIKENAEKYCKPLTKDSKMVVVLDLKSLPILLSSTTLRLIRRTISSDELYYGEGLHTLVVINAPVYFTAIWAVIKPWLDPITLKKVRICGSSFLDVLQSIIPIENIPVEYGGTKNDFFWSFPENFC